jgi:hypothetical protein
MMKNTLKIQGRGIGKTKEVFEIIKNMIIKNPYEKIHIVADRKNHKAYMSGLEKIGIETKIIEQTDSYVVLDFRELKCKK